MKQNSGSGGYDPTYFPGQNGSGSDGSKPMTTEEKKCLNCGATWGQIFNNPHQCSDGELPLKRHKFAPPETGRDTVREKFKKLLMVDMSEQDADKAVEFLLSIVREAVNKEIQSLRDNGKNTEYPHALSDIHDALMEVFK